MINDRVLTMSQNTLRLSDLKSSSESRVTLEQTSDTDIFRPWNKIWMSSKSEIDWYQNNKIISKICVKFRCLLDIWFALRSTKARTRAKSKCVSFLWKISYDIYLRNETSWNSSRRSRRNQKSSCHTFPANEKHSSPVPSVSFTDTNLANEWKRYLGPAALVGPHGRSSSWVRFGGRACLCATEHLRGVTSDEAACLGLDERTQLHELRRAAQEVPENYEDLTSQPWPRHRWKVQQNHQGNPKSRHAMTWISAWTQLSQWPFWKEQEKPRPQHQFRGGDVERVDTRLWPKSLTEKLRKVLSSQVVWRVPWQEQGKTGKDETELIGPEDILMTKS